MNIRKLLILLALPVFLLFSGCAILQTTDLADYGNTVGEEWHGSDAYNLIDKLGGLFDDGTESTARPVEEADTSVTLPIFPSDQLIARAVDTDYHHLYRYSLLDDELFTRLSCTYSAADYAAEVERFEAMGATYEEDLFSLPAYVWMLHDPDNSEYVLLEQGTRTIHYIACQFDDLAERALPRGWYPDESLSGLRIQPPETE